MTDGLTDKLLLTKVFESSGLHYFNSDFKEDIVKEVIEELYYSHNKLIFKLHLKHIDRAIYEYRQASEQKQMWNSKNYFKACILSAIKEIALDEEL